MKVNCKAQSSPSISIPSPTPDEPPPSSPLSTLSGSSGYFKIWRRHRRAHRKLGHLLRVVVALMLGWVLTLVLTVIHFLGCSWSRKRDKYYHGHVEFAIQHPLVLRITTSEITHAPNIKFTHHKARQEVSYHGLYICTFDYVMLCCHRNLLDARESQSTYRGLLEAGYQKG
jgi:hypothetical protein